MLSGSMKEWLVAGGSAEAEQKWLRPGTPAELAFTPTSRKHSPNPTKTGKLAVA
jgi:hypothetical protein